MTVVLHEFKHGLNSYLQNNTTNLNLMKPIQSLKDVIAYYKQHPELDPSRYGTDLLERAEATDIHSEKYQSLVASYRNAARAAIYGALGANKVRLLLYPTGQYKETISPTSIVGYPIITIPAGVASNRIPYGLSIHGKRNDHLNIFKLALALQSNGPPKRVPPRFFP